MDELGKAALALLIMLPTACERSADRAPAPGVAPPAEAKAQVELEPRPPAVDPPSAEPSPADPLPVFTLARLAHDAAVVDLAWSADGAVIATASSDGKLRLWDAHDYTLTRTIEGLPSSGSRRVAISEDGGTVVTNVEHQVHVFVGEAESTLTHDGPVFAVAVTADATVIASGGVDGLRIWAADGRQRRHVNQREASVSSVQFSADGRTLASGWGDGRVRVIDAKTGKIKRTIEISEAPSSVAYSSNGERVAARIGAAELGIFATATGKITAKLPLAQPLGFGAGGNLMLAAGPLDDSEFAVTLIEANGGGIVRGFLGHAGTVNAAVFSPDDNFFASASSDATVLIWAAP
ncbi:WD40 repeat domain-containing protein [Enhygromyxa salina]|uniref:WD domain, G-beta repeat n=1 Tax=Enhygromyxa salina TaxID=215803 RepID=A0A2S9XPQ3_9BACT|nr:hypothetical protein [Enhygromyxa salina]PRP94847.1 WD domain, G-beta repeat [Enhygromyxa salina]